MTEITSGQVISPCVTFYTRATAANTMNLISETLHNMNILIDIAFADFAAVDTQLAMSTGPTIVELEKRLNDALEQ